MTQGNPALEAAGSTVATLFENRARTHPGRVALQSGERQVTYGELADRSRRIAAVLAGRGVTRGDRVAVVSENRTEYLEVVLGAAVLGATVACPGLRAAPGELVACLDLVEPAVLITSEGATRKFTEVLERRTEPKLEFGDGFESELSTTVPWREPSAARPEDVLVVIYTSGTTGVPKGAAISHRAEIARSSATRAEYGLAGDDAFVAWSPLSHMGAFDNSVSTLISGGKVVVVDGFDTAALAHAVATERLGWLLLMPGTVRRFAEVLREKQITPKGVRLCGVMPDLIGPDEIAEITRLLDAPFANTFGATETGCPPCSGDALAVGVEPRRLSKVQSAYCEIRLVGPDDEEVPDGQPGELCMRGPTVFSGYWNDPAATAHDFRGGWFHLGDVFVRNPDGTLDFVDRAKYLIKSGGENIYPAEIERALLRHPEVLEAVVVRRADATWGEVPVAFVARAGDSVTAAELIELCGTQLAKFKRPREIHFVAPETLPRNASGKVVRGELEKHA
ncbi:class I adenylate-forming enzyme family protein [Amycolatopsis sp. FDAARGOS 1241]|uniref:class I adenylate-forming enzyme family protein n=1 Tax=Amycolatopsis sp. FDAARGOS 1241 TaxID=2778070 RepID=UPI00194E3F89|nr:AMP-binding protein [Amycolatopsis sp. FDAARGOS 1241]QRP44772.1 AMP-binding protein [Amycolatopsis sp. FDAARGOS 1241]